MNRVIVKKGTVFWILKPCSSEKAQRFGGIYCLYLHDLRIRQGRNQQKQAASLANRVWKIRPHIGQSKSERDSERVRDLGLVFHPEDGDNVSLRYIALSPTRRYKPEDRTLYSHSREKLKSNIVPVPRYLSQKLVSQLKGMSQNMVRVDSDAARLERNSSQWQNYARPSGEDMVAIIMQ
jgi:hypothetical protein